jgi:hypothetical protein
MFDDDYEANLQALSDSPMSAGFWKLNFFFRNELICCRIC